MDFFFDDLKSSSASRSGQEDAQMTSDHRPTQGTGDEQINMTEDTASSRRMSSTTSITESQVQRNSSSIEEISRRAQELVEKINDSRNTDQKLLDNFQEKLVEKVTQVCQLMKDHMYTIYEENSNEMQVKLQELSGVLESCTKLNSELTVASQALSSLRGGPGH